jgi:hypothetical protein
VEKIPQEPHETQAQNSATSFFRHVAMGKANKKPKKHLQPAPSKTAAGPAATGASGVSKRKHTGKKDLVQRLEADASSAALEKQRRKRSAQSTILGAVDGLKESLEELLAANEQRLQQQHAQPAAASGAALTSKKRQKLVAEETHHMQQVLQHPAFMADPFAALQEHLKNTVGDPGKASQQHPSSGARGKKKR